VENPERSSASKKRTAVVVFGKKTSPCQELNICRLVTRYQHYRNWLALKPGANPLATANPLAPFCWHRNRNPLAFGRWIFLLNESY